MHTCNNNDISNVQNHCPPPGPKPEHVIQVWKQWGNNIDMYIVSFPGTSQLFIAASDNFKELGRGLGTRLVIGASRVSPHRQVCCELFTSIVRCAVSHSQLLFWASFDLAINISYGLTSNPTLQPAN